jgi:hypothetical protein
MVLKDKKVRVESLKPPYRNRSIETAQSKPPAHRSIETAQSKPPAL